MFALLEACGQVFLLFYLLFLLQDGGRILLVVGFCIKVHDDDVKNTLHLPFPQAPDGNIPMIIMVNVFQGVWCGCGRSGGGSVDGCFGGGQGWRSGFGEGCGATRGDKWFVMHAIFREGS